MNERLTAAELDALWQRWVRVSPHSRVTCALAEVREHRAARTLYHDEPEFLRVVRRKIDQGGDPTYVDADLLLAIIDRVTGDQP